MHRFDSKLAGMVGTAILIGLAGCFTTFPAPPAPPTSCGNGFVEGLEECDDGNQVSGDGCSDFCFWEAFFCGDGIVAGGEECDPPDGVTCSFQCQLLDPSNCGNGILDPGEECDPPNLTVCAPNCTLFANQIVVGAPCDSVNDCGNSPNPDLERWCVNDARFPGGMCVLIGCSDLGSGDDCPTGSRCVAANTFNGGTTTNTCAPLCTPGPNDNGICREDESEDGAYACYTFVTGGGGVCWTGCSNDANCNDPFLPEPEWPYACDPGTNRCYVIGVPGADIGDPCFDDTDCGQGGECLLGDWTGDFTDDWPGGYCSRLGCEAYAGNPLFDCPTGSTCGTETPWITNLTLDICLADCVGDGAGGTCTRPEYTCMDFGNQLDGSKDSIAEPGEAGWCFDCPFERAVFGEDPSICP